MQTALPKMALSPHSRFCLTAGFVQDALLLLVLLLSLKAQEAILGMWDAGLGQEDSGMIIEGMAQQGAEPTYCMGDDIPLSVLSDKPHMLYDYFKQRFAQVCTRSPAYCG